MSDKKKWIRPRGDGRFEALRFDDNSAGYDENLDAATAHQMLTSGGYESRDSGDVDFEAARLLAGLDAGGHRANEVTLTEEPDGQFRITRRLANGAEIGQKGSRELASTMQYMGDGRVKMGGSAPKPEVPRVTQGSARFVDVAPNEAGGGEPIRQDWGDGMKGGGGANAARGRELDENGVFDRPEPLAQDPGDAKRSGFSNPQLAQDWSDTGPRPSMPRGGAAAPARPRPTIHVQRPETGDPDGFLARLKGGNRPAAPMSAEAAGRPRSAAEQVDAYDQARGESARRRFGTQIARAGAMVNEAITGAKMDRKAWDDLEAQSEEPLQDLAAKRRMRFEDAAEGRAGRADARAERADGRAAAGEGREADLSDPASRVSRQARSQLLLRFPREAAKLTPEELRSMSAADIQGFLRGLGEDRDDVARAEAQREAIAARRAAIGESRADREQRKAELLAQQKSTAEQKRQDMLGRQNERDLQELGKRSQGNADLQDDLTTITGFLDADGAQGDLPGVGPVVSALPEAMITADGTKLRSAATRLYRGVVRQESGQTVTPQEAATALEAYGMGPGKSETAFRQGMAALAQRARRALQNTEAGFNQDVVNERRSRGGVTSQDIPSPGPMPTGRRKRARDGSVWEELSDGSARQVR